jgi:hypothetical protein
MSSEKIKNTSKLPQLRVVFDTSVIRNFSGNDLLKREVIELIQEKPADIDVTWHLPETVRHERQYQILKQNSDLPDIAKRLEEVLGHNLNVTTEIIEQRVEQLINRQIEELKINVIRVDCTKVDWATIMHSAAYREPPFSSGEKEKGFRDALILEAFMQLVGTSQAESRDCRIVLVTGDSLLTEAVKARTINATNIRILSKLEDLKGLINTIASEISEEFIESIKAKATEYFIMPEGKDSLYYKEGIWQQILDRFGDKINTIPAGADGYYIDKIYIESSRFKSKEGQRIFWVNQITVQTKAYKNISEPSPMTSEPSPVDRVNYHDYLYSAGPWASDTKVAQLGNPASGEIKLSLEDANTRPVPLYFWRLSKSLFKSGQIVFEVTWSAAVTNGEFSSPKVELIEFVESVWE